MLIELKSSPTDPMNTPSRMLQRFKETLILKPNTMVSLHSALITTNAETYATLIGSWSHNGSATTIIFNDTLATDYWRYKTGSEWWRPTTGNNWLVFNSEPLSYGTTADKTATMNLATNTITLSDGGLLLRSAKLGRRHLNTHAQVAQTDDNVILVNLPNFPINSRNSSGNTDNHIATIPLLTDLNDTTKEIQFYEPYNPTNHSIDNEGDFNLNHIEIELLNSNGTQRIDLIHPTQITLRITPNEL